MGVACWTIWEGIDSYCGFGFAGCLVLGLSGVNLRNSVGVRAEGRGVSQGWEVLILSRVWLEHGVCDGEFFILDLESGWALRLLETSRTVRQEVWVDGSR